MTKIREAFSGNTPLEKTWLSRGNDIYEYNNIFGKYPVGQNMIGAEQWQRQSYTKIARLPRDPLNFLQIHRLELQKPYINDGNDELKSHLIISNIDLLPCYSLAEEKIK